MIWVGVGIRKKPPAGCTTQKTELGMQQQIVYHNPNIQISSLEVPVGMVDGILTKFRNPVNHDLWLTGRFSTSVNHSLFLSLHLLSNPCNVQHLSANLFYFLALTRLRVSTVRRLLEPIREVLSLPAK